MADHENDQRQRLSWRKHWIGQWLIDTAQMDLAEQGAFMRMIDLQWVHGPLPEAGALARQVGCGATKKLISAVLERHFTKTSDGWINSVVEQRRQEAESEYVRRSKAGRAAAVRRWHGDDGASGDANRNANRIGSKKLEVRSKKDLPVLEGEEADQPHIRALEGGKK